MTPRRAPFFRESRSNSRAQIKGGRARSAAILPLSEIRKAGLFRSKGLLKFTHESSVRISYAQQSSSSSCPNTNTGFGTTTHIARFTGIPQRGPTGSVAPWSEGLPPSECTTMRAGVPIPMHWVLLQDGVDLIHFVFVQCDVHGCEILQDPRFFRRAGDSDDVRTCMLWNKSSGERIPSTLNPSRQNSSGERGESKWLT